MQDGTNSLRKLRRDWWKTKLCTACVSPLGRFLSRGGTCPQCGLRVCKNCRSEDQQTGTWVCVLCSGGMPSDDLTKTTKSLGRDSRSIRRSWTISNPQRAQTNSPILKSYTVLYPEDGVMTDGSGGCGSSNDSVGDGAGCSVSTGHLSNFQDVNRGSAAGSNNRNKLLLGGSDQGIHNASHSQSKNNYSRSANSAAIIGLAHQQAGGVNQRKSSRGSNGVHNDDDHDQTVNNGLSATRQFHSLPRMSSNSSGGLSLFAASSSSSPSSSAVARVLGLANKVGKRSFKSDIEKENIKRHRSFQTTLHPYNPSSQTNPPPSPATSVNFIEETFWDYYDYELENSSSDPGSTPRNLRKSATAAAISDIAAAKRPLDNSNKANIPNNNPIRNRYHHQYHPQDSKSAALVAFRTDSNRSSCERSLGETMDYDCSLKMNQFSSLSDTEINETSKYDGKEKQGVNPTSTSTTGYRRHSNELERYSRSSHHHPPHQHYATISSTKNPYLPASEYVYRRRHDDMLNEAPPKPERKSRNSKRSVSLNAYDGRRLFSPLKTYCVLMKENIEPAERKLENNVTDNNRHSNSFYLSSQQDRVHPKPVIPSATTSNNSAILNNNSSPISLSLTTTSSSSPLKFNSLPRERYIRIEREDGGTSINVEKYSSLKFPSRKNDLLLGKSSSAADHYHRNSISPREALDVGESSHNNTKGRNVTRVPIVKDDSHVDTFPTHHSNFSFTNNVSPPKNKIERSQSHREISSSSRSYPYYHHYHPPPQQQHHPNQHIIQAGATVYTQNVPQHQNRHHQHLRHNLSTNSADKSSTTVDLNFTPAGTTATLPTNFRTKGKTTSSSLSVWDESKQKYDTDLKNANTGPSDFFRSDFEDGSDVVIENFIKTHSSSGAGSPPNNNTSNTLPKIKYPPSTTHISLAPHSQRRGSDNENLYYDKENVNVSNKSDFKETNSQQRGDSSDNYLRQCSTFPRGASSQRNKPLDKNDHPQAIVDSSASSPTTRTQTEHLPNFYKNNSNDSRNTTWNNVSNFPKGYPRHHDEPDVFFHPTTTSSKEFDNVPKQQQSYQNGERIVPIKINTVLAGGPGSSATLPHPYIRRKNQVMTNGSEKSHQTSGGGSEFDKHGTIMQKQTFPPNSGPSISEVEMDIERDIYFQKTRSLDRVRPSSKLKLKSVLSLGRSNNSNTDTTTAQQNFPTMEIDYSDSQPYNNKSRLHEKLFSIDQVDRNTASNARNKGAIGNSSGGGKSISSVTSDLLQPQQIHHSSPSSSNTAAPIPSPRLKRKAKLQHQQEPMMMITPATTLCSPKINGDEMSSSTSSSTKLIGPGTNYGSKKLFPSSPSNTAAATVACTVSTRSLNESDPHCQAQQHDTSITRASGAKTNAPNKSSTINPISFGGGNSIGLNESSDSSTKFNLSKETSMNGDQPDRLLQHHYPHHQQHTTTFIGGATNDVDGTIKSEKSTCANHISGPVMPNYTNSDSPGANFMISNSPPTMNTSFLSSASAELPSVIEFDLHQGNEQQFSSSPTNDTKHFSDFKTKTMHNTPSSEHNFPPHNHQQIKSALANNTNNSADSGKLASASGGGGKAVRFEPHIIAMEIESEQRKLLQQQINHQQQQPHQLSGSGASGSVNNNTSGSSTNGINSLAGSSINTDNGGGVVSGMKSNSGNHMHRHGHHHANKGSSSRHHPQQQHYVHASSYLPVLYHSYHQQQHKYIRKGTGTATTAGGVSGVKVGKKSKKYKGFVARAIAKVKSKAIAAAAAKKDSSSTTTTTNAPTVYYPVGKQGNSPKENFLQHYNSASSANNSSSSGGGVAPSNLQSISTSNPSSSSVITYISPQPPTQQSLLEVGSSASQQEIQSQQHSNKGVVPPSITVSLSSIEDVTKGSQSLVSPTKVIGETAPGEEIRRTGSGNIPKKYTSPGGRHKKTLHNKSQKGAIAQQSSSSRMDGYTDNLGSSSDQYFLSANDYHHQQSPKQDPNKQGGGASNNGLPIPESFLLHSDRITPSSTSSSSSSSFTSNLQESYELFHNQTLPAENGHEMMTTTSSEAALDCHNNDDSDEEKYDSLNEDDEDSDNANDDEEEDGPSVFKSFDEMSDFGEEDEDDEPDFVFYPTPQHSSRPLGSSSSSSLKLVTSPFSSSSSSARHHIDMDRNKAITSVVTSSTDVESYAPFAPNNETTTKGNIINNSNRNSVGDLGTASFQYSDLTSDKNSNNNSANNKGKSSAAVAEPKMVVVGIPTFRSPNSTRLINNPHHHNQPPHHYGKSQASFPNANPTGSSSPLSKSKENVKQSSSSTIKSFSQFHKESPHPLLQQQQKHQSSNNEAVDDNAITSQRDSSSGGGIMGASFGTHKDSSYDAAQHRSSNNRYQDISGSDKTKQGLVSLQHTRNSQLHSQNKNQVDDDDYEPHHHHHHRRDQDDDVDNAAPITSQQSQPFVPFHDKNNGKGRHYENQVGSSRMYERSSRRDYYEHERNADRDDNDVDQDTLQKDVLVDVNGQKVGSSSNLCMSTTSHVADSHTGVDYDDDNNSEERVSSVNPHDAKGFRKISTSKEGVASAVTTTTTTAKGNSTGTTVYNKKKNEGRLSDLTSTSASKSKIPTLPPLPPPSPRGHPHSQEQLVGGEEEEDEEALGYGGGASTSATNAKCLNNKDALSDSSNVFRGEDNNNKLLNVKNNSSLHQQRKDQDSLLQARNSSSSSSSWASSNKKTPSNSNINGNNNNGAPNNTDRENHNTVANNENQKDVERLQRLELVKRQHQNILTHINNTTNSSSQQQKENFENVRSSNNNNNEAQSLSTPSSPQSSSSSPQSPCYYSLGAVEQPNSLETQCANDQSFLSESEVKSPSPSPRFKAKKFGGGRPSGAGTGASRVPKPNFHFHHRYSATGGNTKKCGDAAAAANAGDSGSEEEQDARSDHHHHLLNSPKKGKGKQSKSDAVRKSGSAHKAHQQKESDSELQHNNREKDSSSPLFYPDSGPTGMSILPPQHPQHTKATSSSAPSLNEPSNVGKFKSRVLLNSDDLEDEEELSRAVADVINSKVSNGGSGGGDGGGGKSTNNGGGQNQSGKKNITTVEISGDVGIVSNNLQHNVQANVGTGSGSTGPPNFSEATSINIRQGAVSSDHLQSSGLSLIQQPNLLDLHSSSEEEESSIAEDHGTSNIEKPIEPEIKAKFINKVLRDPFNLAEVGSSVSANESSGDNDTEKTSDDNSSDWQSESTNTVIFRGNLPIDDPITSSSYYANPNGYLDPEIQINNITVGDFDEDYAAQEDTGNGVNKATSSSSAHISHASSDSGKVNVGYKAAKVNKVSADLIIGIKNTSSDNPAASTLSASVSTDADGGNVTKIGSKRKFDKGNDASSSSSSSSSSAVDSSEELGKSNETLTDIPISSHHNQLAAQHLSNEAEEQDHLEVEMVMHSEKKVVNSRSSNNDNRLYVPNNTKSPHHRRESPEGQEQEVPDQICSEEKDNNSITDEKSVVVKAQADTERLNPAGVVPNAKEKKMEDGGGGTSGNGGSDNNTNGHKSKKQGKSVPRGAISKEKILQNVLSQIPSRSSPDGADKSDGDATPEPEVESPTPAGGTGVVDSFDVTSDEDSWVEEILFEDEDDVSFEEAVKKLPPPLDLTLHTIVEESCEESEAENSGNFYQQSTSGLGGSQKNTSRSQSESNANELEKYFNFGIYTDTNSGSKNSLPHEESEFSDTFSESSFSLQEDDFDNGVQAGLLDPAELASTRLEKYFYNLGGPQSMMNSMGNNMMMTQNADSDSVGSESDSDNSVLEKRKKVLKHHRRSADFEEEFGDKVSDEEDSFGFGQDGFDTIKKTARKAKKSGSEGSINNDNNSSSSSGINHHGSSGTLTDKADSDANQSTSTLVGNRTPSASKKSDSESSSNKTSPNPSGNEKEKPVIKVNRSNSFTWSSDEEVNIMMSKLRQLIKNLIKSKTDASSNSNNSTTPSGVSQASDSGSTGSSKDKQLVYLENELIRLMKSDNLKNIVEYLSSEESDVDDVYKFIKVVNSAGSTPVDLDDLGDLGDLDIDDPNLLENLQSTIQLQQDGTLAPGASPKSSPALLAKVMHHIGNRLSVWMKDEGNVEEDNNDDNGTLKCAPSVSSDLNEDRFSWKGSFESALAAKRQSVGSTDSISSSDYGQDKSMLRSSSLHHLTTSQPIEENKEEEEPNSSLPRMTNLCNSLPRLNQPNNPAISRAHSLVITGKNEQQQHQQQPGTETYPVSISGPVKSARYRPPGFQPSMKAKRIDAEEKTSPSILSQSTPVLTQDSTILKNRSDSMGSILHDVKPVISVKGQVEFGLQYNYKLACLEVRVVGCRDLASADSKRNRSDPYVKAYLLPDKSKAGKRKTKTKKNTLHPVFDEILKFPLTLSDLQKRTLWLSVWHSDMFGKNEFLGEILVPLKDRVFDDPNPGWWDLQEMSGQMEDMPKGDVVIALKWTPKTDSTGNLSVLVKEAKNLVPVKNGSPSTFVKCALLSEKTRKQKTSICRRNFNPIWNQTLLFEDVDDDGVEITIWNHDLLASHDLIGTVRLEYDNPLWESMISRPSFWVEGGLKLS